MSRAQAYLESLVLQHSLDGCILSAWRELGLEDNAKRAVADDLALRVCKVLVLAGFTVLDFLANDFCNGVSN